MLWSFLTRWWICRWFLCVCQRLLVTEPEKVWGGGDNIWRFAQKNNNYNSVTVTLRCGLLFAPSVTTGRSQGAVREALQMTMWRVGVMERFSKAWDSSTLPLMVLAVWIYAQIIICTGRTKMTLFPLLEKRKIVSFCLLLFASRAFRKPFRRRHEPVCWHLFAAGCTERLLFFRVSRTAQIFTCRITTAQHGKENIQGSGAK